MNTHARWRREFAQRLSTHLQQFAEIQAIAVLGSVARGYSDAYSDLELLLVWNELPSPDQQSTLLRALHAQHRYPTFDPGYQSAFRIQGGLGQMTGNTYGRNSSPERSIYELNRSPHIFTFPDWCHKTLRTLS